MRSLEEARRRIVKRILKESGDRNIVIVTLPSGGSDFAEELCPYLGNRVVASIYVKVERSLGEVKYFGKLPIGDYYYLIIDDITSSRAFTTRAVKSFLERMGIPSKNIGISAEVDHAGITQGKCLLDLKEKRKVKKGFQSVIEKLYV